MNKTDIFKTARFWLGFLLFFLSIGLAVVQLDLGIPLKFGLVIFALVLFSLSQLVQADRLSKNEAKRQIETRLKCVDTLKVLDSDQDLRSNVFLWDSKKGHYYIFQHYGMESDLATSVTEIPKGKGCTGVAWDRKQQIWGNEKDIFEGGEYALPKDEEAKVNRDLKWICSTPVTNEKRNVIAVLNFDGNKLMDEKQRNFIKHHAARVAGELNQILSKTSLR